MADLSLAQPQGAGQVALGYLQFRAPDFNPMAYTLADLFLHNYLSEGYMSF
jgi:hypothetical protein